jgi:hypothetical protein
MPIIYTTKSIFDSEAGVWAGRAKLGVSSKAAYAQLLEPLGKRYLHSYLTLTETLVRLT